MAIFKATMIFNAGRQGWTESFYLTAADYASADPRMIALAAARIPMLGLGASLEAYRLSNEAIFGDALTVPYSYGDNGSNAGLARDVANTCALMRVQATDLYRRTVTIRGVPDEWVYYTVADNSMSLKRELLQAMTVFGIALVTNSFQIKSVSKDDADVALKKLDNATVDPVKGVRIVPLGGNNYANGDVVRISKARGTNMQFVNGTWTVTEAGALDFFIRSYPPNPPGILYLDSGEIRRKRPAYTNINRASPLRPASRKTGRAFFVPRGRR